MNQIGNKEVKMDIRKESIKADLEYLTKKKERLQHSIKLAKLTIIGINRNIKIKESML